jgi:hypothetical protein
MSSEAKAIECSIQLKEGSVVYQKKPDGYRICCLPVQVRKLWELTFVLSNLHTAVGGPAAQNYTLVSVWIHQGGTSKLFVQWTCGAWLCRVVASFGALNSLGELNKRRLS